MSRSRAEPLRVRAGTLLGLLFGLLNVDPARAQTIDFDGLPSGSVVTMVGSTTLGHAEPGIDLVVATGLPTTSAPNYLGAADPQSPTSDSQDLFLPGDTLQILLGSPVPSLSVVVLSTAGTPPGAFQLATPGGVVTSGATPTAMRGDDEVFVLVADGSLPIDGAELRSASRDRLFAFHVDDIQVPEPQGVAVFGLAIPSLAGLVRRRLRALEDGSSFHRGRRRPCRCR
ncbi:MAG: hypothetical protein R3F35_08195 [Myxococcota bacterium]